MLAEYSIYSPFLYQYKY
uniref:Uncharacterized protein n=1 Tax=Arundo donax TaxID=35708 RepID=A0A0A9C9A0_ARUDO